MARKHSNRGHDKAGRRPSNNAHPGPRPRGFTGPGYRQVHALTLPGLAGAEKRQYYNRLSGWVVLAAGIFGCGVGFACLGWVGGVLGLAAGFSVGGRHVEKQRYYRR